MSTHTTPQALPARYIWHAAVGSANVDCKAIDPSGITNPGQNKRRPAIGFMVGTAGAVLYQDSHGRNVWLPTCIAGQYYQGDIAKVLYTGTVTPAETGTESAALTPTAFRIALYWDA